VAKLSQKPDYTNCLRIPRPSFDNIMPTMYDTAAEFLLSCFMPCVVLLSFAVISFCLNNYDKLRFYGLRSIHEEDGDTHTSCAKPTALISDPIRSGGSPK